MVAAFVAGAVFVVAVETYFFLKYYGAKKALAAVKTELVKIENEIIPSSATLVKIEGEFNHEAAAVQAKLISVVARLKALL